MRGPKAIRRRLLTATEHEQLAEAAREVFGNQPDVIAAYLYGSAARDEPAADLDIAVLFRADADPARVEALAAELQARGAPRGPEIDLRLLRGAAPRFQTTVLREARLLFERDRKMRLQAEVVFMSMWADFKPTWDRMRRRMLDRWARG